LVVTLTHVAACGQGSKGETVLTDEGLFPKEYPEAVAFARGQCPEFAESAETYAAGVSAQSTGASLSVHVADSVQPQIAEITRRHGPPDSSSGEIRYYGELGFRVGGSGEVVELVVDCMNR
jgi:hypothetical protein